MLKIERVVAPSPEQVDFALEAMRNPLNSWNKSDSLFDSRINDFRLGEKDKELAVKLRNAGSEHRKFLRQFPIGLRVTAPMYWWKEFDTYKVGTVRNSCSTMHKIHSKEFTLDDFSVDRMSVMAKNSIKSIICYLNELRNCYLNTKDKEYWYSMIQLLPSSYNQTSNITMNYETLLNIYNQRRGHKLDEWHTFCDFIEKMPYSELIVDK